MQSLLKETKDCSTIAKSVANARAIYHVYDDAALCFFFLTQIINIWSLGNSQIPTVPSLNFNNDSMSLTYLDQIVTAVTCFIGYIDGLTLKKKTMKVGIMPPIRENVPILPWFHIKYTISKQKPFQIPKPLISLQNINVFARTCIYMYIFLCVKHIKCTLFDITYRSKSLKGMLVVWLPDVSGTIWPVSLMGEPPWCLSPHNENSGSCAGRCSEQRHRHNALCFCDKHCIFMQDCCFDFLHWCNANTSEALPKNPKNPM